MGIVRNMGVPIVIGGCHRSGTSLVRRVLDAHSRIHCGPEVTFLRDFHNDYPSDPIRHLRFHTTARSVLAEPDLLALTGRTFIAIHAQAAMALGKPRWADKAPENVIYHRVWTKLLGESFVFVNMFRGPLDTIASMRVARFHHSYPATLAGQADHYVSYVAAGIEAAAELRDRYLPLKYEDLVRDPGYFVGQLMHWLGEDAEDIQLVFNAAPHQAGLEDPNVPATGSVHADSVGLAAARLNETETDEVKDRTSRSWEAAEELVGRLGVISRTRRR